MHQAMPREAAYAWMKLDEVLLLLQRAARQIDRSGNAAKQGIIIQGAIDHVEAAMELIK